MGASLEQRGASLCCKLENHTACPVALNPPASPSLNPLRAWNSNSSAISSFAWAAAITLNASTPRRFNTPKHTASTLHSYPITKPDMPKATALCHNTCESRHACLTHRHDKPTRRIIQIFSFTGRILGKLAATCALNARPFHPQLSASCQMLALASCQTGFSPSVSYHLAGKCPS